MGLSEVNLCCSPTEAAAAAPRGAAPSAAPRAIEPTAAEVAAAAAHAAAAAAERPGRAEIAATSSAAAPCEPAAAAPAAAAAALVAPALLCGRAGAHELAVLVAHEARRALRLLYRRVPLRAHHKRVTATAGVVALLLRQRKGRGIGGKEPAAPRRDGARAARGEAVVLRRRRGGPRPCPDGRELRCVSTHLGFCLLSVVAQNAFTCLCFFPFCFKRRWGNGSSLDLSCSSLERGEANLLLFVSVC
jgi:hypothetical protein